MLDSELQIFKNDKCEDYARTNPLPKTEGDWVRAVNAVASTMPRTLETGRKVPVVEGRGDDKKVVMKEITTQYNPFADQ